MCGRYTLAVPEGALLEAFDAPKLTFDYEAYAPRHNVAPGQEAPVVAEDEEGRRIGLLEWGFFPSWKDEPKEPFVNARAESVASKRSFSEAFRRRRCLVPADGFYEWRSEGGRKIPYWFHAGEGEVLSFAGIWETWRPPRSAPDDVQPRHGFAILTTDANADVSDVHHRMPVVIPPSGRDRWLDRETPAEELETLLTPARDGTFEARRVSTRVNRPDDDDAGLIEEVEA
ncbi:MAG: SOS response-associated peptidase [Longimicrobiales bacterium]|nr:SOS response-associated peptidase [Longimicrobiales bacterium]